MTQLQAASGAGGLLLVELLPDALENVAGRIGKLVDGPEKSNDSSRCPAY